VRETGKATSRIERLPPVDRHVRYEGAIDACSPRGVVGWIREVSNREIACRLRLNIDGVTITEGFADRHRADLGEADDGRACCGFILPLPSGLFDGDSHGIQITVLGDAWRWQSLGIQTRFPRKEDVGEVSGVSGSEITGWCRDPFEPEFRQEVDLLIDGYFAGGTKPLAEDEPNPGPEFRLEIPPSFRDGKEHELSVVVRGSRICLWEGTAVLEG
jgi:hypothetical protein